MVKSSILFALLLGVIFAQMIPTESSDAETSDEGENSDTNDSGDESDNESPALTCLLFGNLGCDAECSTAASAFSIKGFGNCVEENICQCSLQRDESLEGLFRAKFNDDKALEKIKQDKKLAKKVLEILRVPFQTAAQTKRQLSEVGHPAINSVSTNDQTPAWKSGLVDETDKLDQGKIEKYVSDRLKPILNSSSKKLLSVNYKSKMKKSLEGESDQDVQDIINEVRRTNNKNLNHIVNAYLKSTKTKEIKNTDKYDIIDAIRYQVVDQFVKYIEVKKKAAAKKPSLKQSPKKDKKKHKPAEKKPSKKEKPAEIPKKLVATEKTSDDSSKSRFELPGFDKDFIEDYGDIINETFETDEYSLQYQKNSRNSINFNLKKGNDVVMMSYLANGLIHQEWHLGDAKITLDRGAGNSFSQSWDFGKTKCTYIKNAAGSWSKKWTNGKKDEDSLWKHQQLMDEWCEENDFLLAGMTPCTIY